MDEQDPGVNDERNRGRPNFEADERGFFQGPRFFNPGRWDDRVSDYVDYRVKRKSNARYHKKAH
jgi:hypothetical protein